MKIYVIHKNNSINCFQVSEEKRLCFVFWHITDAPVCVLVAENHGTSLLVISKYLFQFHIWLNKSYKFVKLHCVIRIHSQNCLNMTNAVHTAWIFQSPRPAIFHERGHFLPTKLSAHLGDSKATGCCRGDPLYPLFYKLQYWIHYVRS